MSRTHLALTLGPVYRTLAAARFTRELWSASYVLSWLAKEILRRLRMDERRKFIIPYPGDELVFETDNSKKPAQYRLGAGLFPDRIIFSTTIEGDYEATCDIIREVVKLLGTETADHLNVFGNERAKLTAFLDRYFHIFLIEKKLEEGENPVLALTPLLDAIEWQQSLNQTNQRYLALLFDRSNGSFLAKDGFGKNRHSFETLIEIALRDFEDHPDYKKFREEREGLYTPDALRIVPDATNEEEEEDDSPPLVVDEQNETGKTLDRKILTAVKKDNESFRVAHKYVAIVHSDGDNVGAIVKSLEEGQFQGFSQDLHEFALQSAEAVHQYGGMPVYAGGDDLLFFAPVVRHNDHILRLLHDLNGSFITRFKKYKTKPAPALSFGVSIGYYKYPLAEALETSRDLLFYKAKRTGQKNNIALQVLKHSGAAFGGIFSLGGPSFAEMIAMLQAKLDQEHELLSSIIYKIRENETLFSMLGARPEALGNFIHNSFNELEHNRPEVLEYLEAVKRLVAAVFRETADVKIALSNLYGALRLISFLHQKDSK